MPSDHDADGERVTWEHGLAELADGLRLANRSLHTLQEDMREQVAAMAGIRAEVQSPAPGGEGKNGSTIKLIVTLWLAVLTLIVSLMTSMIFYNNGRIDNLQEKKVSREELDRRLESIVKTSDEMRQDHREIRDHLSGGTHTAPGRREEGIR
jgi:hypothetical protein